MAGITNSTGLYTSNTVIVDSTGASTPLTTVTEGILAAIALGTANPTVYIRAGTYTENLTLVNGINLRGDDKYTCIIDGLHTVPAAGQIQISNLKLAQTTPATNLFVEGGAGTCAIDVIDCIFNIDSGIAFNLPLSTGPISITGCSDISTANSIIDNTTGLSGLSISESSIGTGAVAALIAGNTAIQNSLLGNSMTISGAALVAVTNSYITGTVTVNDTAQFEATNSTINSGANIALTVAAGANASLSNVVVDSTVGGGDCITGAGSCTFGEVTFVDAVGVTVTTQDYTTRVRTGSLQLDTANTANVYLNAGLLTAQALTDGQLQIGSTGAAPVAATITAGAGIVITNGAGSISVASTSPFIWEQVGADGALVVNQGSINTKVALLTMSLPAASAVGDTMILQGLGAGGWIITQAANQQIIVGNQATTVGVGGSLASTNANDSISLVCTTADLVWSTFAMIGNLTVV